MSTVKFKRDILKKIYNKAVNIKTLLAAGEYIRGQIVILWSQGKGGDNRSLGKVKSESYRKKKKEKLGTTKVDMLSPNTGNHLRQSIEAKKGKGKTVVITTNASQMDKLRGNYRRYPSIMKVSKKIVSEATKVVKKILFKV
jgi:hypothetical protein